MSKQDFDDFLVQQLQEQKQELTPERDLWPGIERAINAPQSVKKPSWKMPLASAAAVLLVCAVGFNVQHQSVEPMSQLAQMSDVFTQQKQSLLVQYQAQPALTDNWQQQLSELEDAEQAIKTALEEDPNNRALLSMLAQVYQQQLNLINTVHKPKQGARLQHI